MANEEYRQLVEFLTREFGQIHARFAQIDSRFAQIDARFAQVDGRFDEVDARFTQVDGRFAQIDVQLVAVRRDMGDLRRDLRAEIQQQGERFEGKLGELRRDMDDRFDEVKGLIRLTYVDLDRRVRRLEERG